MRSFGRAVKTRQAYASALLPLLGGAVLYGWLFWLPIDFHEDPFWPVEVGELPRTVAFKVHAFAVRVAPLAAIGGFVLAIVVLIDREKHRLLATLGLGANLLVLCASVALMNLEERPRRFNERELAGIGLERLIEKAEAGLPEAQNWLAEGHMYGRAGLRKDPVLVWCPINNIN